MASKRRTLSILLSLLALFLLGTVAVLSTISFFLRIEPAAYITELELSNSSTRSAERIPRIIHQTWKSETLPERWKDVSQACRDLMPDYEYKLWTDASSREFITTHYSWFLPTFDAYQYPIQRADAIRYFVLHHFGGVYLDLDVGCLRPLDPLLVFPVILPKTIPVGISNDLMFAEKEHPFLEQTIHSLATFDHSYILNYPTVMFSTGPMFLSAQFGLYTAAHPAPPTNPGGDVRVLPKALYGKNAKPGEAPHSFFEHHYGSSWHADDAAFITFLGKRGNLLMWLGLIILVLGTARLFWQRYLKSHRGDRRGIRFAWSRYEVVLPRAFQRDGNFQLDLGFVTMPISPVSTDSSAPPSPSGEQPVLPLTFDVSPPSPPSENDSSPSISTMAAHVFRRARRWVRSSVAASPDALPRLRRRRSRGVMYFLPAIFTPNPRASGEHNIPLLTPPIPPSSQPLSRSRSQSPHLTKEALRETPIVPPQSSTPGVSTTGAPPPPYTRTGGAPSPPSADWTAGGAAWDDWTGEEETLV